MHPTFELKFKVRDYECDLQGIVNNSVYQNYLEHTRHEFLSSRGLNFSALSKSGTNLVVTRIELNYKKPLHSGDEFIVGLSVNKTSKIRGEFQQSIHRISDNTLILDGKVQWAAINANGRPFYSEGLDILFD